MGYMGLVETGKRNFEGRQGIQTVLGHKLLVGERMEPSECFCNEQSSHFPRLESPGRSKSCTEDSKV